MILWLSSTTAPPVCHHSSGQGEARRWKVLTSLPGARLSRGPGEHCTSHPGVDAESLVDLGAYGKVSAGVLILRGLCSTVGWTARLDGQVLPLLWFKAEKSYSPFSPTTWSPADSRSRGTAGAQPRIRVGD